MFDAYTYLKSRLDRFADIRKVVRITGLSGLEELTDDIRNNEFPCIAVDAGADGTLDISAGNFDRSFNTFYVLIKLPGTANAAERDTAIRQAATIGRKILKMMQAESYDFATPCYGFEANNIQYSRFGPIGLQCYGYAFNYVMSRDHE